MKVEKFSKHNIHSFIGVKACLMYSRTLNKFIYTQKITITSSYAMILQLNSKYFKNSIYKPLF